MSLVATEPQPKLAWDFNGTTAPYIGSATGTVSGVINYGQGKYNQDIVIRNPITGPTSSNIVTYSYSTITYLDHGLGFSFWIKPLVIPATDTSVVFYRGNSGTDYRYYVNISTSAQLGFVVYNNGSYLVLAYPSIAINTWYHVFVQTFNGTMYLYINGSLYSQQSYTPAGMSLNSVITVGGAGNYGPLNAELDDLRIFDQSLTSLQVQSIYRAQGVPGRGVITSDSYITSGLVAYYDTQNLRYPNSVSGTTWYDISGNGRSVTIRPGSSYNSEGKYITFDGTVNSGTTVAESGQSLAQWTVMCAFMQTANGNSYARVAGSSPNIDAGEIALFGQNLSINPPESSSWTNTSFSTTYNVWYHMCVAFDTTTTGVVDAWVYINGALVNSYTIDGTVESLTGYTIGARKDFNNEAMIGRMSLFAIYNRVLSQSEVSANYEFYKKTQIPTYLPIQLTGTPLFNQLSPSATSSAVGAFSLRSVNGLSTGGTARAVNVRIEQPVGAFTGTSGQYGTASSSSNYDPTNYPPWKAFNKIFIQNGGDFAQHWVSGANYTQGVARTSGTVTVANAVNYYGDWLQIQFPSSFVPVSYSIAPQSQAGGTAAVNTPGTWYFFGSIDGSTWNLLDTRSGIANSALLAGSYTTYNLNGVSTAYSYYRIVCNIVSLNTSFSIAEMVISTTQDFYADERGNLLTAPVTGTTLQNWLGGATGYVTKWYDQSGRGNHAEQTTAANQPIIQRATKGPGYMVNFNGISQFVTLSASYDFLNGTNITLNAVAQRNSTKTGQNYVFGTNAGTNYRRVSIGFASGTSLNPLGSLLNAPGITIPTYNSSNEPTYYMTGVLDPSRVVYNNDVVGATNEDTGLLSVQNTTLFNIGYNGFYYQGNLFELLIFTSALNQTQVTQVYQNQLSYTGT